MLSTAMTREDEDEISDVDVGQKVWAARVLGPRGRVPGVGALPSARSSRAGKPSSWWSSWEEKAGTMVPKADSGRDNCAASALLRHRERNQTGEARSKYFAQREPAKPGPKEESNGADLFDQFAFRGSPSSASVGTGRLKPASRAAESREELQEDVPAERTRSYGQKHGANVPASRKGRRQVPEEEEAMASPRDAPPASNVSTAKSLKVVLRPFQNPRQAPAGSAISKVRAASEAGFDAHPGKTKKLKPTLPVMDDQPGEIADGSSRSSSREPLVDDFLEDAVQEEGPLASKGPLQKPRRGRILNDSSEEEEEEDEARTAVKRKQGGANVSRVSQTSGDISTVTSTGAGSGRPQCSSRTRVTEQAGKTTVASNGDKARIRSFFVSGKRQNLSEQQSTEEILDDTSTLEDDTDTLEDDDVGELAHEDGHQHQATPARPQLRNRDAPRDDETNGAGTGEGHRNSRIRKRVVTDEDDLCQINTLSDDEEDAGEDESIRGWSHREMEEVADPVVLALRKCETIAASLQKKLNEGVGEMHNKGDKQGHQAPDSNPCFSQTDASGTKLVAQADVGVACGLNVELKPYQLVGVNFLVLLSRQRVGGAILADEMGLGKTVQAISFLAVLAHLDKDHGPHLVVAPASLLENWQRELKRWCPKLKVLLLHGVQREEARRRAKLAMLTAKTGQGVAFNVMLTCYSLFERDSQMQKDDRKFLLKVDFSCVLMDEAHLLKDRKSQRTRRLRKVADRARHRLMLTGTPLQNNLLELWSLLELLHPTVFSLGGESEQALADHLSDQTKKEELIARMKAILAPFVLRRVKADVMQQLSPKIQKLELLDLVAGQQELYAEALRSCRKVIEQSKAEAPTKPSKKARENAAADGIPKSQVASIFTHLRKVANHPLLVRHVFSDRAVSELAPLLHRAGVFGYECTVERVKEELINSSDFGISRLCQGLRGNSSLAPLKYSLSREDYLGSAKCQALAVLLPRLQSEGHRPLIFSQWTSMLDILEHVLEHLGLSFVRLDGSTQVAERQELVDQFNEDRDVFAFLLSTRAGGQGLNLTGADTVILHDVDFNPQMDRQAEDRVHRIGQTRPVTIIRLVSKGTVDENILRIADRKLSLDAALLSKDSTAAGTSEETSSMAAILSSLFKDAVNATALD